MLKILCPGSYTWRNKGDAALVASMLTELRRKFPTAQYTVLSDTPNLDAMMLGEEFLPIPFKPREPHGVVIGALLHFYSKHLGGRLSKQLGQPTGRNHRLSHLSIKPFFPYLKFWFELFRTSLLLKIFGARSFFLLRPDYREAYRRFLEADFIVFVPGGYFLAPHRRHLHWLKHLFCLALAKALNKQVIFFAVTTGPFVGELNRWLARRYLNKADLIVLREESSMKLLADLGVTRPRISVTTDVAFLLPETKTDRIAKLLESQRASGSLTVGMALRAYDFPSDPHAPGKIAEYPITLAKAIDHLIDVYDASVILMPQVIAPESNDVDFSREVLDYVNRTDRVHIVEEDLTPGELKWLYGHMDAFVGVRMHANIFALASNVPIVAIAYEPKTAGIMRTIGLSDYVLDILTLTEFALKQKIDELVANRQSVVAHLKLQQDRMRKTAQMSADIIYDYVSAT